MRNYFQVLITLIFVIAFSSTGLAKVTYLSSLAGEEFEMGNLLEWSTLQEINSKSFIVESSPDGINYTEIGFLDAAGNSNEKNKYSYLHIGINEAKIFYRLKQTDTDDGISFSHTILVKKSLSDNFTVTNISSSEVTDELLVSFESRKETDMTVEVLDETSTITIYKDVFQLENGSNEFTFSMTNYPEGIYRIALTMETEREILVIRKINDVKKGNPNLVSEKVILKKKN